MSGQVELVDTETGEVLALRGDGNPALPGDWRRIGLLLPEDLPRETWEGYGVVLERLSQATLWWWGDWWRFGERAYGESSSQAAPTGYAVETLKNAAWVADRVELSRRRDDLSFSHHYEVAALPPAEQDHWLALAAANEWSRDDLRRAVRAKRVADARADLAQVSRFPAGTFGVLYADPPWAYDNSGLSQSAESQYPTLTADVIAAFADDEGRSVATLAHDASVLFLWATSPLLPEAVRVLEAWGFAYKTSLVWRKDRAPGIGWWTRTYHELLLVGVRPGAPQPAIKPDSVIEAAVERHSSKPAVFATTIEAMYPGPKDGTFYVELFSRDPRSGWAAFGNEVRG